MKTILVCLAFAITPSLANAACFSPCGSPLSNAAGAPVAGDALFTLRAAIGSVSTCADCECDVTSDDNITAGDALAVLRRAVGQPVQLSCPECGAVDPQVAYTRGRAALERHDLARADDEFECSLVERPGDGAANFFRSFTRVASFVANDPQLFDVFVQAGGTGSLDIYDLTAEFPADPIYPTVAEISPLIFGSFDDELEGALQNLQRAISAPAFRTTVTPAMLPEDLGSTISDVEADAADALAMSALLHYVRGTLFFALKAYSAATVDDVLADTHAVLEPDCGDGFLAQHPDFFVPLDSSAFATAESEFEAAIDTLVAAIDAMRAESDAQDDDLLVEDDIDQGTEQARTLLVATRASLDDPVAELDTCGRTLGRVHAERLFDAPLGRTELPRLLDDDLDGDCKVTSFPDPKLNGLLPDVTSSDALVNAIDEPTLCIAASCPTCCLPCTANPDVCDPVDDETGCFACGEECSPAAASRCALFDDFIRCEDGVY